jgi:hypothetical protein
MFSFAIAAQLIFVLRDQGLQKHERSCFSLWALDALEDVDQFLGCFIIVVAGRQ